MSDQRFRGRRFGPVVMPEGARIESPAVLSRVQGCLLGQLAGDSLGGLVEFDSAADIRRKYPDGLRDLADGGTWRNMAGQPTDDSELALLLARSLAEQGHYNDALVLDAYADWVNDPQTFDVGGTTARALRSVRPEDNHAQRLAAVEKNANRSSEANGSLMRCSPIGIFAAGGARDSAEIARRDSRLTHPNPVCVDACAVFCTAVSSGIIDGDAERSYQLALGTATEPAVKAALKGARDGPPPDYEKHMGHVVIALRNAFHELLHAKSLEEGVVNTVMAGGDTDTNGAIAGALLGAVHGREAIPERWVKALLECRAEGPRTAHPRASEYWPVDALELAEAVFLAGGH
jgi:ADP-ribosylglycohydrolase